MPPNVLLVVLDSVRARNTSLHDPTLTTTPALSTLAEEATTYRNARAPSSWSLPSHASLFTGRHAHEHGVYSTRDRLPSGHTIFESLAEDGYETGVFSGNPFLVTTNNGLKDAFDHVGSPKPLRFPDALDPRAFVFDEGTGQYADYLRACLDHDRPLHSLCNGLELKLRSDLPDLPGLGGPDVVHAPTIVDDFLQWEAATDEPWAACMNLMDAHAPYRPETLVEGDETLVGLEGRIEDYIWDFYAGDHPWWLLRAMEPLYNDAIRDADAAVGHLVETLRARGVLDDTLLVVTSDHGEAFGEPSETARRHRVAGHGRYAIEELLHVPLVVRDPGQTTARVVPDLAPLTGFPDAVEAVRAGERSSFAADGPVPASVEWHDTHLLDADRREAMALEELTAGARVVYEHDGEGVVKTVRRGDRTATLRVPSALEKYHDERVTPAALDHFDAGRPLAAARDDDYDDATMEHLRDLGYA
ncbi:sulfatase [Halomarina ordinaria]|uniref:Sulfatase n=1 Tax=Halomarina ordinaria TaxID=3033939 RepID=A0ABD5U716_9EURY|nr:sulfatase [Halomarina sp. PSRA2]